MSSLSPITELDFDSTFTIISLSASANTNSIGVVWCSAQSSSNRIVGYQDSTSNKRNSVIQTTAGSYFNNMLIQQNNISQHLKTTIKRYSPNEIDGYFNGGVGNLNTSWIGEYVNDKFSLGTQIGTLTQLNGTIQEIIIFPTDKTVDLSVLHTDINNYYSIY